MPRLTFFATCPKTIEDLLLEELRAAGAEDLKETVAGARFTGTLATAYHLCLWSRFASRVFLTVAEFAAASPEELIEGVRSVAWDEHFGVDQTFAVEGVAASSAIRHSDYAALVVKDGIADYFRSKHDRRPDVQPKNPDLKVGVHLLHDIATLNIDLGGGSLHRRAYRVRGVAAPLKENVAAAMLARARWPEIAAAGGQFVDPMCGSGTLAIEAALMAGDVAPGLLRLLRGNEHPQAEGIDRDARTLLDESRHFGGEAGSSSAEPKPPQGWRGNDAALWRRVALEAAERCLAGYARIPPVSAFDRDAGAVAAALANVASAGLAAKISVARGELAKLEPPAGSHGLLAVNPPYGVRVGEREGLTVLYQQIGKVLHERFRGWKASILTGDLELSKGVGLRAARVNTLMNGPIRCVLAHFEITESNRFVPRPAGEAGIAGGRAQTPGRARRSSDREVKEPFPGRYEPRREGRPDRRGAEGVTRPAVSQRTARPERAGDGPPEQRPQRRPSSPAGGASRATGPYHATGGVLAFANRIRRNRKILDRWARNNDITCYRLYDADLPDYAVAVDTFEGQWLHVQEYVAPRSIEPEKAEERLEEVVTILPELLGVGAEDIFVKRRKRRRRTEQYSRLDSEGRFHEVREGGCSFLVNFADYLDTGLFLDHRITREIIRSESGGKRFLNLFSYTGTASVYAVKGGAHSTTSVDSSNTYLRWARENFSANGIAGQQHRLLRADCWEWLHLDRERYDLIFMDPPTFSNAKGKRATLDVQRDHPKLIRLALGRLAPGGSLLFSTNFRRFTMDHQALAGVQIEDITADTIPRDFARNSRIHHCFRIRHA